MPIAAQCECGKTYKVGDDAAGKKFKCKACQAVVKVPVPQTAPADDAFDDFGDLGDDFGDDYGDDYPETPAKPKKSSSPGKAKGKAGGKKKSPAKKKGAGKAKSKKGKAEMAPAMKYGMAGGIVVVTIGIIIGILYANGTLGGGKKSSGENVTGDGDPTDGDPNYGGGPGGGTTPGGGNPNGNGTLSKQQTGAVTWIPSKTWKPNPDLLSTLGDVRPIPGASDFQLRLPGNYAVTRGPTTRDTKDGRLKITTVVWKPKNRSANSEAGMLAMIARSKSGQKLPKGNESKALVDWNAIRATSKSYKQNDVEIGQIGSLEARRVIFTATADNKGSERVISGFIYLVVNEQRTAMAMLISGEVAGLAGQSIPPIEAAALSLTADPPDSNQVPPPQVAEFLKTHPPNDLKMQGKRVRVRGKIASLAQQNWINLQGDGQRRIACHINPPPRSPLQVGQEIALEGEFGNNQATYISIVKCKLISLPKAKPKTGGNKTPSPKSKTPSTTSPITPPPKTGPPSKGSAPPKNSVPPKGGAGAPLSLPPPDNSKPVVLPRAQVRFGNNTFRITLEYKFTGKGPDPNGWYYFTVILPGNIPNYLTRQGKELKKQGVIRARVETKPGQKTSGDVTIKVTYGKTRQSRTTTEIAQPQKVKVQQSQQKPGLPKGSFKIKLG